MGQRKWSQKEIYIQRKSQKGRQTVLDVKACLALCRNSVVTFENVKAVPKHIGTCMKLQYSLGSAHSHCWQCGTYTSLASSSVVFCTRANHCGYSWGKAGSWRTQMPSSRMNLCSGVTGCQLIFPSFLLGLADRPACGVWCGVSCCCATMSSLKSLSFDFWGWGTFSWQDASVVFD